jgi:hypothetical protein
VTDNSNKMDQSQNSLLAASGSDSGADSAELVRIASHVDSPDNTQLDMETENNATKSEGTLFIPYGAMLLMINMCTRQVSQITQHANSQSDITTKYCLSKPT